MGYNIKVEYSKYKKQGIDAPKTMELEDVNVIIVEANNRAGKTSTITSFREAILCKSLSSNPVTEGEFEGYTKHTIPDKNGNPITIIHDFDKNNTNGKFVGILPNGKAIKTVGELREMLGSYEDISADTLFSLALTVPGRRKIIDSYLMKCLSEESIKEINKIDAKINNKDGQLYNERTELNKTLDFHKKSLSGINITEEQLKQLPVLNKSIERLAELKSTLDTKQSLIEENASKMIEKANIENQISNYQENIENNNNDIIDLEYKIKLLKGNNEHLTGMIIERQNILLTDYSQYGQTEDLTPLKEHIAKGEAFISSMNDLQRNVDAKKKHEDELAKVQKQIDDINASMDNYKVKRTDIIKQSSLPAGLSFDGDEIYLNGFTIGETSNSESEMKLALAELKCRIDTAKLMVMGNISSFGPEALDRLCQIAEENGKIVLLERVTTDDEVSLVAHVNE